VSQDTNETNQMWRAWRADVVIPMRERRLAQAQRDADTLGLTVRVLSDVSHHWRCTTGDGLTFDYWPTTKMAHVHGKYVRGLRLADAIKRAERGP
jgi:hypothetical protein